MINRAPLFYEAILNDIFLAVRTMNKHGQTVCLNMIVKDEAHIIQRCLASVKPLIDSWLIVDTGSTDGTQTVIREILHDVPGEIVERPWVNFAHNRAIFTESRGLPNFSC